MNKPEIKKGTIKRIIKYITSEYKKELIIVFVCIILSSIASVAGSLFLQTLIDNYITLLLDIEKWLWNMVRLLKEKIMKN